jgi:hypothetical protein
VRKENILNFRIEQELHQWFTGYCRKHRTTMTQLLTGFILSLRIMEKEKGEVNNVATSIIRSTGNLGFIQRY